MQRLAKLLPPLALVGALALVPVTASSFAATDTTNYQELEKFFSVFERVKANYVDQVDDIPDQGRDRRHAGRARPAFEPMPKRATSSSSRPPPTAITAASA